MKICSECSAENLPDSTFCSSCGAQANWNLRCPQCGSVSQTTAAFCSDCGRQIGLSTASEMKPNPAGPTSAEQSPSARQPPTLSLPSETKTTLKRKFALFVIVVAIVFALGLGASLLHGGSKPSDASPGKSSGSGNSLVLSQYEQTCQPGGWVFGDLTGVRTGSTSDNASGKWHGLRQTRRDSRQKRV